MLTGVPGSTSRTTMPRPGFPQSRAIRQRAGLGALHPVPRRGVEGTIVLAADIEDDAGLGLRRIAHGVGLRTAGESSAEHDSAKALAIGTIERDRGPSADCPLLGRLHSQHLVDHERRRGLGDSPTRTASISSGSASSSLVFRPILHAQHGIAGAHGIADGRRNHDTDRRIDLIIYFVTPASERHRPPGR